MAETPAQRVFADHNQVNILFADGFASRHKEFEVRGFKDKTVCITFVDDTRDFVLKLAGPGVFDVIMMPGWLDDFEDWTVLCDAVRATDVTPRAVFIHSYDPDRAKGMIQRIVKDRPDILVAHIPWDPKNPSNHVIRATGGMYR